MIKANMAYRNSTKGWVKQLVTEDILGFILKKSNNELCFHILLYVGKVSRTTAN